VLDTNDRYLREVTVGESPTEKGATRKTGFTISVGSEIMAILALATDMNDLKTRLAKIVVGMSKSNQPITADDLVSVIPNFAFTYLTSPFMLFANLF